MNRTLKDLSIIAFSTIFITILIWLPHLLSLRSFYNLNFSNGFNTIYRNFDGLEYIIIAKTLYSPEILKTIPQPQLEIYYASHFPLYSLFIIMFSPFLGFLKSMLFVSVLSTIGSAIAFYFLITQFKLTKSPLLLSLIFLILPARWLIVHNVGSSEPLFIFFCYLHAYLFHEI